MAREGRTVNEHNPYERRTLLEAVQQALTDKSPELFELPDYDYGRLFCFEWNRHFVLDFNSRFAQKIHGIDEFGYYVK